MATRTLSILGAAKSPMYLACVGRAGAAEESEAEAATNPAASPVEFLRKLRRETSVLFIG